MFPEERSRKQKATGRYIAPLVLLTQLSVAVILKPIYKCKYTPTSLNNGEIEFVFHHVRGNSGQVCFYIPY
jgi:hypothetical protein